MVTAQQRELKQAQRYGLNVTRADLGSTRVTAFVQLMHANRNAIIAFKDEGIQYGDRQSTFIEYTLQYHAARHRRARRITQGPMWLRSQLPVPQPRRSGRGFLTRVFAPDVLRDMERELVEVVERILTHARLKYNVTATTYVQVAFVSPAMRSELYSEFKTPDDIQPKTLVKAFLNVLQSDDSIDLNQLTIQLIVIRTIQIDGTSEGTITLDFADYARSKRSIVTIQSPHHCLLLVGLLGDLFYKDYKKYRYFVRHQSAFVTHARSIYSERMWNTAYSLLNVYQIEIFLSIRMILFEFRTMRVVYDGQHEQCPLVFGLIDLSANPAHCHFVNPKQVNALFAKRTFCWYCMDSFSDIQHNCVNACGMCGRTQCVSDEHWTKPCTTCGHTTHSQECLVEHHAKDLCGRSGYRCLKCFRVERTSYLFRMHHCDYATCGHCGMRYHIQRQHQCYHTPKLLEDIKPSKRKYAFFDYECAFEGTRHVPVGIVVIYAHTDDVYRFETNAAFIQFVVHRRHKHYTFIAHNGGRYDFHFVKRGLLEAQIPSSDLMRGRSIMTIQIHELNIRFIDSFRFLPFGLRKFPKTFGLQGVAKTYFPYRFFTTDRVRYHGPMPDIEWFDHPEDPDFQTWYQEHAQDTIDLYAFCMDYCVEDVRVLKQGCLRFQDCIYDITNRKIDAFNSLTIASLANTIFRAISLPPYTIACLAQECDEYRMRYFMALGACYHTPPTDLHTDGRIWYFYSQCHTPPKLYVYQRCYANGCRKCYPAYMYNRTYQATMGDLSLMFVRARDALHVSEATQSILVKECDYIKLRGPDLELPPDIKPLAIRDAFYGGRTEPFKLYYRIQDPTVERIYYYDIRSLYPSVQNAHIYGITPDTKDDIHILTYPIGHPQRLLGPIDPDTLGQYFGFAYVDIEPPSDLYIPFLPERRDGKLVFDCTRRVATYTTIELLKALDLGYVIHTIYEILHFPKQSHDLFRPYFDQIFNLKLKSSGWDKVLGTKAYTLDDQHRFLQRHQRLMKGDVPLCIDDIQEYNPGMYTTAKLLNNSQWGKLAQRAVSRTCTDTVTEDEFTRVIYDARCTIDTVLFHSDTYRTVISKKRNDFNYDPLTTNVALAAYVTAHARMRLYAALELLQDQVLYCDTDSVIFVQPQDRPCPLYEGTCLGEWTNELEPGDYIVEFMSTGPKSYAYRTANGDEVMKIKGISLKQPSVRDVLTYDAFQQTLSDATHEIHVQPLQFDIDADHTIRTRDWGEERHKTFRYTGPKRRRLDETPMPTEFPDQHADLHYIDTAPYTT